MALQNKTELVASINRIKKEKNAIILAHNYQMPQIQEVADILGDSLELARKAHSTSADILVFCGVRFMAETAKILAPGKKVLLPVLNAGCPLADTITAEQVLELKQQHSDAGVITYVNSSAEVKALSDICCTSGNAVKVVKNAPYQKVLFIPDKNLGWWVKQSVPEKQVITWKGYCPVHERYMLKDVLEAKQAHPEAELMVHPECRKSILEQADYVLSTAGMLSRAHQSSAREFIIGTEDGILFRLEKENPTKKFYPLASDHICKDMKMTDLSALLKSLETERYEVELKPEVITGAKKAIQEMIKYV